MRRVPRPAKGEVEVHRWKDGRTVSYRLRVPYKGRRPKITLGTNHEGWDEEKAAIELERIIGQIERGTWSPPVAERAATGDGDEGIPETLHVTTSRWWQLKKAEGLEPKTKTDYEWRLKWLLRYQPHDLTKDVDAEWVDNFKLWLGQQISEKNGEPLSPRSRNMILILLAMVLDLAVKYKTVPANAARGKDTRVPERKSAKRFLTPDMVVDLLDAAQIWESELPGNQRFGRRALLASLVLAGPRVEEVDAARLGDLDIHTEVLRIDRSKTPAGERDIDLTAYLLGEVRPHLARLPKIIGGEPTPRTPIFPTRTGNQRVARNVQRLLTEVVRRANVDRAKRKKLLIPEGLTPHDLRRTFACLCFWAGRELPYVQAQIGHEDGRMVLDAYAHAEKRKRVDRELVWELMHFSDEEPKASIPETAPVG